MNNFRPGGFAVLPTVVKNLLMINVLFFLATIAAETVLRIDLADYLGLHYIGASDFHPYQLVTYMFMHGSFAHLFFNMFALWMFGRILETVWGSQRFLFYYILCGVGAGLVQEVTQYFEFMPLMHDAAQFASYPADTVIPINGTARTAAEWLSLCQRMISHPTVGASGAVYSILLAFGMLFPNQQMFIFPLPMPIKAKWVIIGYFVLEIYLGLKGNDSIAHFAHLGGMIFGFILIMYWKKKGTQHGRNF